MVSFRRYQALYVLCKYSCNDIVIYTVCTTYMPNMGKSSMANSRQISNRGRARCCMQHELTYYWCFVTICQYLQITA